MLIQLSVNSDWLFNTQSRVLQADWFILEINEMATRTLKCSIIYFLLPTSSFLLSILVIAYNRYKLPIANTVLTERRLNTVQYSLLM